MQRATRQMPMKRVAKPMERWVSIQLVPDQSSDKSGSSTSHL